eukprot:gb/GEZN01001281.1/.p1 GENE.gb/GEZN01001281.1/~~gb/GEZN01001281.1/.p1  ORF type:complete len:1038 (-),score=226.63 gb/GEZN01001281.1/:30-3143(-)
MQKVEHSGGVHRLPSWGRFTVEELRSKEAEFKAQAEKKKEELRQLVGLRYRVLIETADSIMQMKDFSHQGIRNLTEISKVLTKLRHRPREDEEDLPLLSGAGKSAGDQLQVDLRRQYEMPELLWQELSSDAFLNACNRLSEALALQDRLRHVAANLAQAATEGKAEVKTGREAEDRKKQESNKSNKANKNRTVPVPENSKQKEELVMLNPRFLSQQRALLYPFRARILQHAWNRLHTPRLSVGVYSEALRAIAKLQSGASNEQMLRAFLAVRSAWLQDGLAAAQQILAERGEEDAGLDPIGLVSAALSRAAYTLRATIFHTAVLFSSSSPATSYSPSPSSPVPSGSSLFAATPPPLVVSPKALASVALWLRNSLAENRPPLEAMLGALATGKQVGVVRDNVLAELAAGPAGAATQSVGSAGTASGTGAESRPNDEDTAIASPVAAADAAETAAAAAAAQKQWRVACVTVLADFGSVEGASKGGDGRRVVVSLWKEFFAQAFAKRSKELIEQSFSELKLDSFLSEVLARQDVLEQEKSAKTSREEKKRTEDQPHSSTEPKTFSWEGAGLWEDEVTLICERIEGELALLVTDTGYLLRSTYLLRASAEPLAGPDGRRSEVGASNTRDARRGGPYLFSVALERLLCDELLFFVQTKCTQAVSRLVSALKKQLSGLQAAVLDAAGPGGAIEAARLADRAVLVGRVCRRLARQSTALKQIVTLAPDGGVSSQLTTKAAPLIQAPSSSGGLASQARLSFVQSSLLGTAQQAFRIWTRVVAQELADSLHGSLRAWLAQGQARPEAVTALWSTDGGGKVELDLPLPGRPSRHILPLAFQLVKHLSRVHGHQVDPETVGWALLDSADAVLATLQELIAPSPNSPALPEHLCLQLLFDTQTLFSLLRLPSTSSGTSSVSSSSSSPVSSPASSPESSALRVTLRPRYATLLRSLEEGVDPINYSVSRKHLTRRVDDVLRNSSVLLGVLTRQNPFPALSSNSLALASASSSAADPSNATAANLLPLIQDPLERLPELPTLLYPLRRGAR